MGRRLMIVIVAAAAALGATGTAQAKLVQFSSPSRNIGCQGDDSPGKNSYIRCDIGVHAWKPPAKPASCDWDWGGGLYLAGLGRARYTCASDTTLGSRVILKYGAMKRIGSIRCWSLRSGMKCQNSRGWGFKLSRQKVVRYRVAQ